MLVLNVEECEIYLKNTLKYYVLFLSCKGLTCFRLFTTIDARDNGIPYGKSPFNSCLSDFCVG